MSKTAGEIIPNKSKPTFNSFQTSVALSTVDTLRKQSKLFALWSGNWVPSQHGILFSYLCCGENTQKICGEAVEDTEWAESVVSTYRSGGGTPRNAHGPLSPRNASSNLETDPSPWTPAFMSFLVSHLLSRSNNPSSAGPLEIWDHVGFILSVKASLVFGGTWEILREWMSNWRVDVRAMLHHILLTALPLLPFALSTFSLKMIFVSIPHSGENSGRWCRNGS